MAMVTASLKTEQEQLNENLIENETFYTRPTSNHADNTNTNLENTNSINDFENSTNNPNNIRFNNSTSSNHNTNQTIVGSNDSDLSAKWRFYNIVLLGGVFMLLFTAYQTCAMIQVLVLEGANIESNNTAGDGYTSLAVVYTSLALSNWVAPSVVEVIGAKSTMLLGGSTYCIFLALFLKPNHVFLYLSSALLGFGAAVLWAAQGCVLAANSTADNMTRNTNIFWGLFQMSLIWGNLIVIFKFTDISTITSHTRTPLFIILTVSACVGVLAIVGLKKVKEMVVVGEDERVEGRTPMVKAQPLKAFKKSFSMLFSKDMLLLSVIFLYTGIELSYWSVLVTSVGHMTYFGSECKQMAGLCGLFIGIGQISASLTCGVISSLRRLDKRLTLMLGFLAHAGTIFVVFLIFPSDSPLIETDALAYVTPSKALVFVSAFLLGFGDSCISTQIYPTLRQLYLADIASACALFKFIQSLACASSFVYSRYAIMEVQLLLLSTLLFIGTILFFVVERRRTCRSEYNGT